MAENPLTAKQIRAASLLVEDELNDDEIAAEVGVGLRTLSRWKTDPFFIDAMAEHARRIEAGMLKLAIAKRHKRVEVLAELLDKSLLVVAARAEAYASDVNAHGGSTGLLVRQEKIVGSGKSSATIVEYQVDTGLVKQIESLMERAAKELGQEVAKTSTDTTNRIIFEYEDVG